MAKRIPWDEDEVILLLDTYELVQEKPEMKKLLIKALSSSLRQRARDLDVEIDDIFRNSTGINMRLQEIEKILHPDGVGLSKTSKLFRQTASLYTDHKRVYFEKLQKVEKYRIVISLIKDEFESTMLSEQTAEDASLLCLAERNVDDKDEIVINERKELMKDKAISNEDKFFKWLRSTLNPMDFQKIKTSYRVINTMLSQRHLLDKDLFLLDDGEQVKNVLSKIKMEFAEKKMRADTNELLSLYITFLEGKINKLGNDGLNPVNINDDWILYDFSNSALFAKTYPALCTIQGETINGRTWAQILTGIASREIIKKNPAMDDLFINTLPNGKTGFPFLMETKLEGFHCRQIENGYWINVHFALPVIMRQIADLCFHCGYKKEEILLYANPKKKGHESQEASVQVSEDILDAIRCTYGNGLRFDETIIHLLEQSSSEKIDMSMQYALKKMMFHRSDDLYFLPDMIVNQAQSELIDRTKLLDEISEYGCLDLNVLFQQYISLGRVACLRDENDFNDFIMFIMPNEIRIGNALKTKIIRKVGVSVNEALENATDKVVSTIEANGCITQEDLLAEYPFFSEKFLRGLLEKYSDEIITMTINDFLCYQTIESMGFDEKFSSLLVEILDEIENFSLEPSQEVIHALLSVNLGCNLRDSYNIPDDKTFRRIISVYYTGEKKREWKSGNFVEVGGENV